MAKEIKEQGELKRNLSLFEATVYSVSFLIGTGVFLKPSAVLAGTGSTGVALLVWLLGGFISLCSALTIAEIAAYIPKLGGMYIYLLELYGNVMGFMNGWINMLIAGPGGAAASAIAFTTFASFFVQLSDAGLKVMSIGIVILFCLIQMFSTKASMGLQTIGTIGKLVPIFAILIVGLINMVRGTLPGEINFSLVGGAENGVIGVALLGVLWAFDGWQTTCTLGGEMVKPEKNLPRAIIISLTLVTAIYILFNYIIFKILPTDQILNSGDTSVGVLAAKVLFGAGGASLVSIGMLISSATTLNAQIIYSVRVALAMAQRKQVIGAYTLSRINPKYDTPINSIIFIIVLITLYIVTGTFNSVSNLVIFVGWVFFVLTVFGIFKLRKIYPRNNNLYSVPLYPITPILGIIGGAYLMYSTIVSSTSTAIIGIAVTIVGFPMYYYTKKKYGISDK